MQRVQVNYDPGLENLRTTASPDRQIQRVPSGEARTSKLAGFIGHLAKHYPDFRQLQEQWQKIEQDETRVWAEGMSTKDLADKVH